MIRELKSMYPNHQFTPYLYTPYPGTALYDMSIECGFTLPETLEGWSNFGIKRINTPWIDEKYRDRYNSFVRFYYPFAFPSENLFEIMNNHWAGWMLKLLSRISSFRLKKNFFYLRLEWKIANWVKHLQSKIRKEWLPSIR
jgi:radical SAM superfamily enzyme YgiQ (UPF0313 family)